MERRFTASPGRLSVLVLAPYSPGTAPSQRFRFEQYVERLAGQGIDMDIRALLDADTAAILYEPGHTAAKSAFVARAAVSRLRDIVAARRHDVVFVSRETYPLGYPFVERALSAIGVPYVFDFDDSIFLPNASSANRFATRLKYAGKTRKSVELAALVIAGNDYLAEWARPINPNVRVIPTTIDTDAYRAPERRPRGGPLTIGWTGSRTTVGYLEELAPLLAELQREHGVRLRVIGDPEFTIEGADVEALPWREQTELEDLEPIDIGLMPLTDDRWSRGKCGLKALQYMALGIPTVMSPVAVNRTIAEDGAALLASSPTEWREALTRLIQDPEMRVGLGDRGRRRVEQRYSTGVNLPLYVDALRSAVSPQEPARPAAVGATAPNVRV